MAPTPRGTSRTGDGSFGEMEKGPSAGDESFYFNYGYKNNGNSGNKDDGNNDGGNNNMISLETETVEYHQAEGLVTGSPVIPSLGPVVLAVVCGCALSLIVTCIAVLLWYRHRCRRRKLLRDLTFDGWEEGKGIKSAPQSRTCSPRSSKRMSCPDTSHGRKTPMLVRSMTTDRIPDFALPPERIQPNGQKETTKGNNKTQQSYQSGSPLAGIRPQLYHHQSFSEDDEPNLPQSSLGRLWFSLLYDHHNQLLSVTLIKVKDLPGRGNNNVPRDPFVKIYLLPDEKSFKLTKTKKKTCSPIYNETYTFQISEKEVAKRVIRFSVYDVDKRRVRHSLGHALIQLKDVDKVKGETMCCDLESVTQANSSLGEIQLSLSYLPQHEKIKVGIHRARKLQLDEDRSHMGVYVKIQLYYGTKCHRMKRTSSFQVNEDTAFHESLSFSVNGRQLDSCNLVVTAMTTPLNTYGMSDAEYGRVVIGSFMYARGDELVHWQEMIAHPKTASTRWHTFTSSA